MIIKNIKQKVQEYIFEDHLSRFSEIHHKFTTEEGNISPALCFLTLLHLSNEHNLQLTQTDSSDFEFRQPGVEVSSSVE